MNAYELAENISLDNCHLDTADRKKVADMLRQQADEKMELTGKFVRLASENNRLKDRIAELEKDGKVCATCGGLVYDPVLIQKSETVGTVIEIEEVYGHTFKKRKSKRVQWLKEVDVGTPLYTTPQTKDKE